MKLFTKQEWLVVGVILFAIALASFYNFRISLMRARDVQRMTDVQTVTKALAQYNDDFGFYPSSSPDGRIIACKRDNAKVFKGMKLSDFMASLAPCEWGKDSLSDITDATYPAYLKVLPKDPKAAKGFSYRYISDERRFQIFASLERRDTDEYVIAIVKRNMLCGTKICNAGRASGATPLDKSIEEYENELLRK